MTSSSAATARLAPIRFGLRFKIIFALTLLNVMGTMVFAWNHYQTERTNIIEGVQQRLATAARALPDMLPPGYLDRAVTADAVSEDEYRRILDQLSAFCTDTGLLYLYSYFRDGDQFHTTSSNGTAEEIQSGTFARYWETYDEPLLHKAWTDNQPQFGETGADDVWGRTYFLILPAVTANGTRYLIGADISIAWLYARLDESLKASILIGAVSFVTVFLFSFYLGAIVSRKITRLAEYTQELAEKDFQPVDDNALRRDVTQIQEDNSDEIAQLARSFLAMESRLNTYLRDLTETTASKERLSNELRIAGEIQLSMLPQSFKAIARKNVVHRVDLHATVKPAKQAGGDLYDFFHLDDEHVFFAVGDVSDKGMPAALFMTVATTLLRSFGSSTLIERPDLILAHTNDRLEASNSMCQFVTLFAGIIHLPSGRVRYANGGHNRPYLCPHGGTPVQLPALRGVALGVMPAAEFEIGNLQLAEGDTLFLYSDGVTEALNVANELYGETRLEAVLQDLAAGTASAAEWTHRVLDEVESFAEGRAQADDITILSLRFHRPEL
jgi:sigma-B regulation protein RsbU (phosphoserine phosphatase)